MKRCCLALGLVSALAMPLMAKATLVRYDFLGTGAGGASGHFDLDASDTKGSNALASVLDWSFAWNGYTFDKTNTSLYNLSAYAADADLNLSNISIGVSGAISADGRTSSPPAFVFATNLGLFWRAIWAQGGPDSGVQTGFTITRETSTVPEPGTLALLLAAALSWSGIRRRPTPA
jgi:hypothetical protein